MSSGNVHAAVAGIVLLSGTVTALVIADRNPAMIPLLLPAMGGLVNGLAVTPDIDLDQVRSVEERRWRKMPLIGRPFEFIFTVAWYPYGLAFRHRGLSHVWFVGTATRFVYEVGLLWVLWSLFTVLFFNTRSNVWQTIVAVNWINAGLYYAGWWLQDAGHLIMDMGIWKLHRKSKWRRRQAKLLGIVYLVLLGFLCWLWLSQIS